MVSHKNFTDVKVYIEEPESCAQCITLKGNVKEFSLMYFGMSDKWQGQSQLSQSGFHPIYSNHNVGIVHIIGPEQGFTVCGS